MADTTYKPYQVTSYEDWKGKISDTVNNDSDYQAAKAKLDETTNNKPVYAGTYDQDVANAYNNIVNREKFQYNLDDDALYKQYADKYMAAGKLAMKNSMGQSAALTGGYGSSYGAAVGQQTYDAYLQGLNDKALEFYDRAYSRYKDEGDRLRDVYGLAQNMADTEYGRYTDLLGQYNTDRSFDYGAMQDAFNNAYNRDVQAYSRYTNDESILSDYAYNLASQGDFTLLAQMFGQEAADNAMKTWAMQNPDAAFARGLITVEQYRDVTGKYPTGYEPAVAAGGYGGRPTNKPPKEMTQEEWEKMVKANIAKNQAEAEKIRAASPGSTSDYILANLSGNSSNANAKGGKGANPEVIINNKKLPYKLK